MLRGLMSDEEWACLEPFVVERGARSGRRPRNHRLLDGIFWIARTGVAWRGLREHFGKWSSVYRQFGRWTLSGLWELLLEAFNDSGGGNPSLQMIDTTTIIRARHVMKPTQYRNRTDYRPHEFYTGVSTQTLRKLKTALSKNVAKPANSDTITRATR